MTDARDWFAVVAGGGPCPDCRFDAGAAERSALSAAVMGEARRWEDLLAEMGGDDGDVAAFRARPADDVWSAAEYAGHVAGVFAVFGERVARLRAAAGGDAEVELGWWDHEAAVADDGYAERSIAQARAAIADGAVGLALSLPRPDDERGWSSAGVRRAGERFTVEGLARFALHESVHHRRDARRSWVTASG